MSTICTWHECKQAGHIVHLFEHGRFVCLCESHSRVLNKAWTPREVNQAFMQAESKVLADAAIAKAMR